MSEILNEALLVQIQRLRAIDLEAVNDKINELKRVQNHVLGMTQKIDQELKALNDLTWLRDLENIKLEVKENKHVVVNVAEKGFLTMIIVTVVACLISIGSFWYASSVKQEKKEAYDVKEWADFGRYVLQDAHGVSEKTKGKLRSEYDHLRKLNKGELLR